MKPFQRILEIILGGEWSKKSPKLRATITSISGKLRRVWYSSPLCPAKQQTVGTTPALPYLPYSSIFDTSAKEESSWPKIIKQMHNMWNAVEWFDVVAKDQPMNAPTYTKPRLKSWEKIKLCPAWYSEFGRSKTTSAQLRLTRAKRAQSFISCTSDTNSREDTSVTRPHLLEWSRVVGCGNHTLAIHRVKAS